MADGESPYAASTRLGPRALARRGSSPWLRWCARAVGDAHRRAGGCSPSFIIVGAQRAGTTTLYRVLSEHPAVARPTVVEGHRLLRPRTTPTGPRWYRGHFPLARLARRKHGPDAATFESSGYYLVPPAGRLPHRPRPARGAGRRDGARAGRARLLRPPARAGPRLRDRGVRGGASTSRSSGRPVRSSGCVADPSYAQLRPPAPRLPGPQPLQRADRPVHRRARPRPGLRRRRRRVLRRPGRGVRAAARLARPAVLAAGARSSSGTPSPRTADVAGAARPARPLLRAVRRPAGRADGPRPELARRSVAAGLSAAGRRPARWRGRPRAGRTAARTSR